MFSLVGDAYGSDSSEESDDTLPQAQPQQSEDPVTSTVSKSTQDGRSTTSTFAQLPSAASLLDEPSDAVRSMQVQKHFQFSATASASRKRSYVGATNLPTSAPKQAKAVPSRGGPAKTSAASMLPPQLRGRSNTATQDLENMGLGRKRSANQ
mmetsp:Transcript_32298/g.39099  ORF Transcript_32298/g.39099 Transcript_32298/m.39099 type:complete len:152 (+) Transcript_32298:232-687(+)|eukprot:CAMPEP_0197857698 /NCGR_PEP_ID=MMETSP1438-20131217/31022_1 /TAXON_ID=1461541 /ORGANISM="Pterosperma sp., Strain CCMP1384" /LENGTH=151 /DNA_ID=CAMNT_0043473627 /DNA_START=225 /DNA_END=680 /DNA_ORIENTATION=-